MLLKYIIYLLAFISLSNLVLLVLSAVQLSKLQRDTSGQNTGLTAAK